MPAAFRVTPPDDNKFLSVKALRFEPRTPVGLIPAIDALRDDAFEALLADQPVEGAVRATAPNDRPGCLLDTNRRADLTYGAWEP
jgi:hypothetical protein